MPVCSGPPTRSRHRRPPSARCSVPRLAPALFVLATTLLYATAGVHAQATPEPEETNPLKRLQALRRQCFRDAVPCVMFSNAEGSSGCAQCLHDVREATVLEMDSRSEVTLYADSKQAERVVMIPEYVFFDRLTQPVLKSATNIVALIVYPGQLPIGETGVNPFPELPSGLVSSDLQEPNQAYNYYPDAKAQDLPKRNLRGTDVKFNFFPFNIFHVNADLANRIRALKQRFSDDDTLPQDSTPDTNRTSSSSSPRFTLQSNGRMFACPSIAPDSSLTPVEIRNLMPKVNSTTCLNDRTCLPIGGQSVWSALGRLDPAKPSSQHEILAVTAPIDSLAFFNDLALGASAEISSLAVLMAVAAALAEFRRGAGKDLTMRRQPVFFAFNAQSWGYAGSDRFLHDLKSFKCKREFDVSKGESGCVDPFMPSLKFLDMKESNISVLNIGQLVTPPIIDFEPNFTFFSLRRKAADDGNGSISQALSQAFSRRINTRIWPPLEFHTGVSDVVPLDATMSFRRYFSHFRDVVTLANYNDSFKNSVYHSMYDNGSLTNDRPDPGGVNVRPRLPLYQAANVIADAVASLVFGDERTLGFDAVNTTIIDEVITCMTANWTMCHLAKEYLGPFYEVNVGNAIPGNYPSSYFPKTRLSDRNPSSAAKNALISAFFAYENAYEMDSDVKCQSVMDCQEFKDNLNRNAANQSALHSVFCSKETCVASETHSHNAFGTAINATNENQTTFEIIPQPPDVEFNGTNPRMGDWTESAWGVDLGLCGYVQDTDRYGSIILGVGVTVFVVCLVMCFILDFYAFRTKRDPEVDEELPMLAPTPTPTIPVPAPVEAPAS